MSRKKPDPYWTVRGVRGEQDVVVVVEAASAVAAECSAVKRAIDVVFVCESTPEELAAARMTGQLWRYTPEARLKCFGRVVGHAQAACLVLCGLATMILDLHAHRIPLRLHW